MRTMQRTPRVNESVVAAELDNEMVLLHVESGLYFGLNELGTIIWSLITANSDEAAITDRIITEYGAERSQVEFDVREFIDLLENKGLLVPESR